MPNTQTQAGQLISPSFPEITRKAALREIMKWVAAGRAVGGWFMVQFYTKEALHVEDLPTSTCSVLDSS